MDDTDLLASPIARGKSLWKMLKRQQREEQREARGAPRGVPRGRMEVPGRQTDYPSSGAAASALGGEHRIGSQTHGRPRRSMENLEDIELPEVRHRDIKLVNLEVNQPKAGCDDRGQASGDYYYSDVPAPRDNRRRAANNEVPNTRVNHPHVSSDQHSDHPEPTHSDPILPGARAMRPSTSDNTTQSGVHVNTTTDSQAYTVQGTRDNWRVTPDSYFVYGPSFKPERQPPKPKTKTPCEWWEEMWSPYGGFHRLTSGYIYVSLSMLFVANIFFLTAFVTNNWGVLHIERSPPPPMVTSKGELADLDAQQLDHITSAPAHAVRTNDSSVVQWLRDTWRGISGGISEELGYGDPRGAPDQDVDPSGQSQHVVNMMERKHKEPEEYWEFGLWQCCRNTDGLCLGPRWAAFYQGARVFAVLALFSKVLTFAWMLGHTLEKLLDYDVCTMSCLISLCYCSAFFTMFSVIIFGVKWPVVFATEFNGTSPHLSFSFFLAAFSFPLTLCAAILSTIDLSIETKKMKAREEYFSEAELNDFDPIIDLPTDNISRPREYKKKRRGPAPPNAKYTATESRA